MSNTSDDARKAADPSSAAPKRPYATLDLKATEIKVSKITEKAAGAAASVPGPAPASSYGQNDAAAARAGGSGTTPGSVPGTASAAASSSATTAKAATGKTGDASAKAANTSPGGTETSGRATVEERVIVKKRGGFFSHLAASLIGGGIALGGAGLAEKQFGIDVPFVTAEPQTSGLSARLDALEQRTSEIASAPAASGSLDEGRIAALEKAVQDIPALAEAQSRLAADTKAALASAASDAGMPEQLTRLADLEDKFKALEQAGANDPNSGRLAQLAALTGKVADLETSLATQLTALRRSVGEDVDARILAAVEASEAARSGTQRIDRDIAGVKTETVRIEERVVAMKAEIDKAAAAATLAQEELTTLKGGLDSLSANAVKPSDIAAAIEPLSARLAKLDETVAGVVQAEAERRANAERVVLALELQNLKRALDGGRGFAAELAEVKKAAGDAVDLKPLEKFKDTGVPAIAELTREFRTAANAAIDADVEPADGGVFDRLVAGAKSIVRVRKTDHAADDETTEAVVGRMESALNEIRLDDILEQAKALSPAARTAVEPFLDKVAARASVDAVLAALEQQLKTSLSATPASQSSQQTQ
jgi:hypothetical protein